jgi:hypothetical protein
MQSVDGRVSDEPVLSFAPCRNRRSKKTIGCRLLYFLPAFARCHFVRFSGKNFFDVQVS